MAHSNRTATSLRRSLTTLALLAFSLVLAMGASAAAATTTSSTPLSPTFPPASDEEEWEEDEEEWEWEEVKGESEGDGEWGEEGAGGVKPGKPPAACQLYKASTRVVAADRYDTVRLALHYASGKAATVKIAYWLKGGEGALQLKPLRRHMSRRGSLHGFEHLSASEMAKVRAARVFIVDIEMPETPSYCERYRTRRLTTRQDRGASTTWSEPPLGTQPPY